MDPTSVTHVLYHADCADGFGAAFAAWKVLGGQAAYLPVTHGEPAPDIPASARVAIVDFSYPRQQILEMRGRFADLVILDHHKTAEEELQGLDFAVFDMEKSGARMAWEYWHPGEELPALLAHVEDKDLWRWDLPGSKEVSVALHAYPMEFELWDSLNLEHLKIEGVALLRLQEQLIQGAVQRARWAELAGYRVPIVNATDFRSEIANRLCEVHPEAPFAAAYYDTKEGERAWSLRSRDEFDVAELARRFGGGGHKNAAGYVEKLG